MIILGFDTSTTMCSVGVLRDGKPVASDFLDSSESHSITLMPMIDGVLAQCGLEKTQLGCIAVGNGPGSFTGIRIAVSTAKTIAYALQIPCAAISTLDAMANCITGNLVCPVINARKNQVYWRLYEQTGKTLNPTTEIMLTNVKKLFEVCSADTIFCGDGMSVYLDFMKQNYGEKLKVIPPDTFHRLGTSLAELAFIRLQQGSQMDPMETTPIYIRKPDAEIHWKDS